MPTVQNTQTINGQDVTIYVEVASLPEEESIYGELRGDKLEKAVQKVLDVADDVFGRGLQLAHSCAIRVVDSIEKMDSAVRPDEYEVQFAIQLSAGIAQIVEFGTEAQMHVSMKWVKPQQKESL